MSQEKEYVLGVALDREGRVLVVRKSRPEWQAGRLNFPGGKVEPGEAPREAVAREFDEEVGCAIPASEWELFLTLRAPSVYIVHCFRCLSVCAAPRATPANEIEPVEAHTAQAIAAAAESGAAIGNLAWILHLALDREPTRVTAEAIYESQ